MNATSTTAGSQRGDSNATTNINDSSDEDDLTSSSTVAPESQTTKAKQQGLDVTTTDALSADGRWGEAILAHRMNAAVDKSISEQSTHPRARWQRAILYAQSISGPADKSSTVNKDNKGGEEGGQDIKRSSTSTFRSKLQEAKAKAYNHDPRTGKRKAFNGKDDGQKAVKIKKELEEQHWLEMIDRKHRYGSNLKYYFEEWSMNDDVTGNFFHWLDHGEGANLSLPKCSREKLEAEQILYMSSDQRKHYLVIVDRETGKFCWKHPSETAVKATQTSRPLVDTTGQHWTDLGEGRGVAPASAVRPSRRPDEYDYDDTSSSSGFSIEADSDSSDSSASADAMMRPGNLRRTSSASLEVKGSDPSSSANKRKEKGDTWIYVSDADYNLYCGIKQKGRFQHSSFLAGGPITSAGTLIIKDGILVKCNPMSGHYRTKADYFKRFVAELEREDADLSQVKIGKTELKLWFIERANALHSLKGKGRRLEKRMEKQLNIGH